MIRDVITVGFVSPPLAASEARQEAIHVTTSFWIAAPGLTLLETLFLTELAKTVMDVDNVYLYEKE